LTNYPLCPKCSVEYHEASEEKNYSVLVPISDERTVYWKWKCTVCGYEVNG
jgi:rubrerythrin